MREKALERLTNMDVNELTNWFSTPAPAYVAGHLAAQSYDPRASGTYDPTTDSRLEKLVAAANSRAQTDWMRVKSVLDLVADGENGRPRVEILRRAFSPLPSHALPVKDFRFPKVALVTKTARARGSELALEQERERLLRAAQVAALAGGHTSMSAASRVLETDAILDRRGLTVPDDVVRWAIWRLLEVASTASAKKSPEHIRLVADVRAEAIELVEEAGDAYRRARAQLGATRRQARDEARREREKLLDEQLGKKRTKEAARFEAKLRRMA